VASSLVMASGAVPGVGAAGLMAVVDGTGDGAGHELDDNGGDAIEADSDSDPDTDAVSAAQRLLRARRTACVSHSAHFRTAWTGGCRISHRLTRNSPQQTAVFLFDSGKRTPLSKKIIWTGAKSVIAGYRLPADADAAIEQVGDDGRANTSAQGRLRGQNIINGTGSAKARRAAKILFSCLDGLLSDRAEMFMCRMEAALTDENADLAPPSVLVRSQAKLWLIGKITAEQAKSRCLEFRDVVGSEALKLQIAAEVTKQIDQAELAAIAARQNEVAYGGGVSCTGWDPVLQRRGAAAGTARGRAGARNPSLREWRQHFQTLELGLLSAAQGQPTGRATRGRGGASARQPHPKGGVAKRQRRGHGDKTVTWAADHVATGLSAGVASASLVAPSLPAGAQSLPADGTAAEDDADVARLTELGVPRLGERIMARFGQQAAEPMAPENAAQLAVTTAALVPVPPPPAILPSMPAPGLGSDEHGTGTEALDELASLATLGAASRAFQNVGLSDALPASWGQLDHGGWGGEGTPEGLAAMLLSPPSHAKGGPGQACADMSITQSGPMHLDGAQIRQLGIVSGHALGQIRLSPEL
jgi:hypothetical protein